MGYLPASADYPLGCGNIQTVRELTDYLVNCRACPRLVAYRENAALNPPPQFSGEPYWAKPVPGFGDPRARIVIAGLAPSTNGSNRTGRMFTGDKSGDFLVAGLHRAGFANQPISVSRNDGLELQRIYLTAPVHCAPPDNKPTGIEAATCRPYLLRELQLIKPIVVITLGTVGWNAAIQTLAALGFHPPTPRPKFAHAAEATLTSARPNTNPLTMIGCYHPSPQNTNTGRLTPKMLDAILTRAQQLAGS